MQEPHSSSFITYLYNVGAPHKTWLKAIEPTTVLLRQGALCSGAIYHCHDGALLCAIDLFLLRGSKKQYKHGPSCGVAEARKKGLQLNRGSFIYICIKPANAKGS